MRTSFTEALHPRGQAGNGGQFREKSISAPSGSLIVDQSNAIPDAFYDVWEGPDEHAAEAHAHRRVDGTRQSR